MCFSLDGLSPLLLVEAKLERRLLVSCFFVSVASRRANSFSVRKAHPLLQRSRFLPSRMGCNSEERDVMGDLYRYHA